MPLSKTRLTQLILNELSRREMRLLVLTVAVRKGLDQSEGVKGDLPELVKSALRTLVASKAVVETEGTYALPPESK